MLFNSAVFVFVYLPIVYAGYLLSKRLPWAKAGIAWLALASLAFYGWWNPAFLPLLFASIGFNYVAGRLLDRERFAFGEGTRRGLMIGAVAVDLVALGWFKYANFIASSAATATGLDLPVLDILLPLGISFYTFTQIAYVVDTWESGRSERSLVAYVLFVTFFPHLIAGPVLHHAEMMPQFLKDQREPIPRERVIAGAMFFVSGLAKKVLIADMVAPVANRAFALSAEHQLGAVDAWFGTIAYTTQIYFDFSGYSDMAIGLALLLGIDLPKNFASPYRCTSIVQFWRCWHMTLSRFLRDYLYIALGGNRKGPVRRQINLMLTMLLGGLWHGAAWTFVVWGGLHGLYLQINHMWKHRVDTSPALAAWLARHARLHAVTAWALTMFAVMVAWVFFRADDFHTASNMLQAMLLGGQTLQADLVDARSLAYVAVGTVIALALPNTQQVIEPMAPRLATWLASPSRAFGAGALTATLALAVITLTLISVSFGSNEFIYFNF